MKDFTIEDLKKLKPCIEGFAWYSKNVTSIDLKIILPQLAEHRLDWCQWLSVRLLNEKQNRQLAIYCAELVLPIFEAEYPNDKRQREAIQAAKDYLGGKISKEELRSACAAADASYAASYAASCAADAAASYAAACAVVAADAAYAGGVDVKMLIVSKALELLEEV